MAGGPELRENLKVPDCSDRTNFPVPESPAGLLPLPPGSRIECFWDGAHPAIRLPRAGFRLFSVIAIPVFSMFFWLGSQTFAGMIRATLSGAEHYWTGWPVGVLLFIVGLA